MDLEEGYVPISRRLFVHQFWKQKRVFSYAEAWIDLIQMARFDPEPGKVLINSKMVVLNRGEAAVSLRFLGTAWGWSKNKVDHFLELLVNEEMIKIGTQEGTLQTIVTILNYGYYNKLPGERGTAEGHQRDTEGTLKGHRRDKTNKDNKDNKDNNTINPAGSAKLDFIDQIILAWQEVHSIVRKSDYAITARGKERAAAGKVLDIFKKKYPEDNSEMIMNRMREYFAKCLNISDDWLWKNMSLPIIISKFNEINTTLLNGRNGRNNSRAQDGSTAEDIARSQAEKLGITIIEPGQR